MHERATRLWPRQAAESCKRVHLCRADVVAVADLSHAPRGAEEDDARLGRVRL